MSVAQVGDCGCGVACLAYLLETDYATVMDRAPNFCDAKCGVPERWMDAYLAEHGHAVQRLTRLEPDGKTLRKVWPPPPWAERHLVLLWISRSDYMRDVVANQVEHTHWVVLRRDGSVMDPADAQNVERRLDSYYKVLSVAAVVRG